MPRGASRAAHNGSRRSARDRRTRNRRTAASPTTRATSAGVQPQRLGGALTPLGSISLLTLPGDHDTWSVTIFVATGDQPLKNLRHEEQWTKAIRACPLHAHWLDGEPMTPVLAMSGIADRYRRFVVDGTPVATGFVGVADAWACTNPSAGRGLTVGFLHALRLRDAVRAHGDNPRALVEDFDRRTEADIAPWYHAQIAVDRARFGDMVAIREGREPAPPANELARRIGGLFSSMAAEPRSVPRRDGVHRNSDASAGDTRETAGRPTDRRRARGDEGQRRARRYPDRIALSCCSSLAERSFRLSIENSGGVSTNGRSGCHADVPQL